MYNCIYGVLGMTTVVMSSVNMIELVWFEMERRKIKIKCQTQR